MSAQPDEGPQWLELGKRGNFVQMLFSVRGIVAVVNRSHRKINPKRDNY